MQYLLLVYGEEDERERGSDFQLSDGLRGDGRLISSEELQPVATATTVRVRNGDIVVSDGPFADTKETLGGCHLIETDSLDEAIEWASRVPSACTGAVEIRPVLQNPEHRE